MDNAIQSDQPAYRRIAEEMRQQICNGAFAPGSLLPSTDELAIIWKSSYGTIQTAMTALAKEGWVERRHGAGTYAVDPNKRFTCAGVYHGINIYSNEKNSFARTFHFALLSRLERLGKETQVFIDHRPQAEQGTLLPALAEAIRDRRIQCVMAPTLNPVNLPLLAKLTIPTAFTTNLRSSNNFNYDNRSILKLGVRHLAEQGCRSVGLISNVGSDVTPDHLHEHYHTFFKRVAREEGLLTRNEWARNPAAPDCLDFEQHGYDEFHHLWNEPEKPDGLIVFPDVMARGVILAALEIGKATVCEKMKFVFHRNTQTNFLCPLPVTWACSDEEIMADGLIGIIERQFAGEKISPVLLPYQLKSSVIEPA